MLELFKELDRLLRGDYTRSEDIREGKVGIGTRRLVLASLLLGAIHGAFMGLYGLLRPESPSVAQWFATVVKVPLLFLLTLLVTYPSLYVFSVLAGSRMRFMGTLRLLLAAITIDLAVVASLGPVLGFFTLSTTSYPFMTLLNVIIFTIGGVIGIVFLRRVLDVLFEEARRPPSPEGPGAGEPGGGQDVLPGMAAHVAARPGQRRDPARRVFRVWMVIFAVVGCQMGWILRPFIGNPELPFTFLRERESNFFEAVIGVLRALLS